MDARIIRAPTPGSIFLARPPWRSYSGTQRATNHLHADKEYTLSKRLREQGIPAVAHGFRSSFRDWCAECSNAPREVSELALAHVNSDRVEAAYLRTDLFERRRALMQSWADYISERGFNG